MKKFTLVFFLFFVLNSFSSSPNYSVTPGILVEDTAAFNTLSIYDIYQPNISSSPIQMKWSLISINIPSGWDYSMCQLGTCFPGIPNGGTMDSVIVGDMGFLGLNINPYFIQGTAIVKVFVYENGFFSQGDTLTWVIHAITTSVPEILLNEKVKLFPNPVSSSLCFQVDNLTENGLVSWSVFNLQGIIAKSGTAIISNAVDLTDLPAGKYFLVLAIRNKRCVPVPFLKVDE